MLKTGAAVNPDEALLAHLLLTSDYIDGMKGLSLRVYFTKTEKILHHEGCRIWNHSIRF